MILGLVELDGDGARPSEPSLQMLTLGRRLAEDTGDGLEAVLIGEQARPIAGALGAYGVSTVHLVEADGLEGYAPEAWAESVVQLAEAARPGVVMAGGTERGQEVMAHVAARLGLPLAANCVEVHPGDPLPVTRQRWGGTLLEDAELAGTIKLLTVAPHAVQASASNDRDVATVTPFAPRLTDEEFRVRVTEQLERVAGAVALTEARVVVGGGRGVGGPDGFRALEELAELLGGTVGCSRAVTSAGWRPHSDQIGQTGVRIAPDLYIACGISGATQHIVGCKGAKHILVVNTDPEAPILARADYAVIGDVRQVISAVNAEIRKALKP